MKFKIDVESKNSCARIGKLYDVERIPNFEVETPLLMLYTKGGSIPHITHEVLQLITTEHQAIQIPLVNTVQFVQPIDVWERTLADFVGFTEYLTCVTVQDPGDLTPSGKHKQDSIPIWTRSGKIDITPDKYMDMIESFKPDMYYVLSDGDTNASSPKKRVQKSVDRTIQFFKKCSERHIKSECLQNKMLLAAISGGFNVLERQRCIKTLLKDKNINHIAGFLIDGLHNNGPELEFINFDDVKPILHESIQLIPTNKLRIVHGCWNPLALLRMIKMGVDIFDSSFPYIVTERSAALTFSYNPADGAPVEKFEINLRDVTHATNFQPLCSNCCCLACRKHTRAYIYHLLNVQELLGSVLLTIHNLHHYLRFFKQIRVAIHHGKLNELETWIKQQYEEYEKSLLKKQSTTETNHIDLESNREGDTIYNNSNQILNNT